jgi:hypothetical protein
MTTFSSTVMLRACASGPILAADDCSMAAVSQLNCNRRGHNEPDNKNGKREGNDSQIWKEMRYNFCTAVVVLLTANY